MKNCLISPSFILIEDEKHNIDCFYGYRTLKNTAYLTTIKESKYIDVLPFIFKYNYRNDIHTSYIVDNVEYKIKDYIISNEDEYTFAKITDEMMELYDMVYLNISNIISLFEKNDEKNYIIPDEKKENFINSNIDELKQIARIMMDNIYLLTYTELCNIYKKIINNMKQTHLQKSYIFILPFTDIEFSKSSRVLSLLFLYLCLCENIVFINIWSPVLTYNFEEKNNMFINENTIYVIVDDASYSGSQLCDTIMNLNRILIQNRKNNITYLLKQVSIFEKKYREEINLDKDFLINNDEYLNFMDEYNNIEKNNNEIVIAIPYISQNARSMINKLRVNKQLQNHFNIIIYDDIKIFYNIHQLCKMNNIDIIGYNKLKLLHLLYTSWKLPDEISFPQQIIGFGMPIDVRYNIDKYEKFMLSHEINCLINNCDRDIQIYGEVYTHKSMYNYQDLLNDTSFDSCPYTFYKKIEYINNDLISKIRTYRPNYTSLYRNIHIDENEINMFKYNCLSLIIDYIYGNNLNLEYTFTSLSYLFENISIKYNIQDPCILLDKILRQIK